jgi:hypothetical protein
MSAAWRKVERRREKPKAIRAAAETAAAFLEVVEGR